MAAEEVAAEEEVGELQLKQHPVALVVEEGREEPRWSVALVVGAEQLVPWTVWLVAKGQLVLGTLVEAEGVGVQE